MTETSAVQADESYLSARQVATLLLPIHPLRVSQLKGMSYVEGYDIKACLNRIFGFGRWSTEILSQELVFEEKTMMGAKKDKPGWLVCYRTSLRLTVRAPDGTQLAIYEESHCGSSTHPQREEAHGNAITNSWTYALKRCATALGDQFGLGLYAKGSLEPVTRWTLVRPETETAQDQVDTTDVPAVVPEAEESPAGEVTAVTESGARPAGQAVRPEARQRTAAALASAETDPAAQHWVSEAQEAADLQALRTVHTAAREAGHLAALIIRPDLTIGGLGQFMVELKAGFEAGSERAA